MHEFCPARAGRRFPDGMHASFSTAHAAVFIHTKTTAGGRVNVRTGPQAMSYDAWACKQSSKPTDGAEIRCGKDGAGGCHASGAEKRAVVYCPQEASSS